MFEIIISFFLGLSIGVLSAWLLLKNRFKTKRERSLPESGNSVFASNASDDQQTLGYETNLAWKTEQSVFNQVTGQATPQAAPQIIEVGHPPLSEVQLELQRLNAKLTEREKVFYPDENALLQAEQDKLASAAAARLAPADTITRLAPTSHETHNTQANEFEIAALVSSMQESVTPVLTAVPEHFDPSELEAVAIASAEFDGIDFENEEQEERDRQTAAAALAAAQAERAAEQEAELRAEQQAKIIAEQQAEAAAVEAQAALAILAAQHEAQREAQQIAQHQAQLAADLAEKLEQERATLVARLEAEQAAHLEAQRVAEENAKIAAEALLALETARQEAQQAAAEVERVEQERIHHETQRREQQASEQAAQLQATLDAQLKAEQAAQLEAQRLADENARIVAETKRAAEQAEQLEAQRVQTQLAAEANAAALIEQERLEQAALIQAQAQEKEKAAQEELERLEQQRAAAQKLTEQTAAAQAAPAPSAPPTPLVPEPALSASQPGAMKSPENTMIMVADDSKVVRIKISRALTKHNYQITLAENGIEAASKIAEARPDVLITDVEMPGMDGFGLTQQLRSNPATMHLPIIMISGASHELADKAKQAGIDVLLGKPYSDDELIGHIHRLLQR
ncbi:response regulator [Undibacterium sp. Ren11W]|uniref:response regulator n=1 Tax=Undibacterium sp. Ren11W TaxID=3413045 RepID=UPI003BF11C0B